jgi:ferredoxin-NADP reductase
VTTAGGPGRAPVPLRDHGYHRLTVKAVVPETAEASSFVLDVPPHLADTFAYRPGQFCTVRIRLGDEDRFRSYSMSSAPGVDPDLTVTVKRVPGGLVSNWLLDHVAAGDTLEMARPAGVFCPTGSPGPVVAYCGGSGITPVLSIAKHVLATTRRAVHLLYANRSAPSVIFGPALADLADGHPGRLSVRHHLDDEAGLVTPAAVQAFAAEAGDGDHYLCGPGPFMDLVESVLRGRGVAPERIFLERFLVEEQPAVAAGPPAEAPDGCQVTISLGGRTVTVAHHAGDTVLETARRGGLRPPFSCQAGDCATCMALLAHGEVRMRANNALTPEEVAEGWILTCQSLPVSPALTVEYEPT